MSDLESVWYSYIVCKGKVDILYHLYYKNELLQNCVCVCVWGVFVVSGFVVRVCVYVAVRVLRWLWWMVCCVIVVVFVCVCVGGCVCTWARACVFVCVC